MGKQIVQLNKINACTCGELSFEIDIRDEVVCLKCAKCGNEIKWLKKTFDKYMKRIESAKKEVKSNDVEAKKLKELKKRLGIQIAYSSRKICTKCKHKGFYSCLLHNIKVEKNEYCKHFDNNQFQQRVHFVQGGKVSPK